MKLYDVPRSSYVKLTSGEVIFFDHIDGMYSYCNVPHGVVHLSASIEVDMSSSEDYGSYWENIHD